MAVRGKNILLSPVILKRVMSYTCSNILTTNRYIWISICFAFPWHKCCYFPCRCKCILLSLMNCNNLLPTQFYQ